MTSSGPPMKKAHLALETPENTESSSSSEEEEEEDEEEEVMEEGNGEELQVVFEARTAESADYHGISRLLKQTFRGEEVSGLTDYVIAQRTVGSVITQSSAQEEDEDEEDEFDDLQNEVFGLMTLIRLGGNKPASEAAQKTRDYIKKILTECEAPDSLKSLLEKGEDSPALIVSERIVNIPAQISVPLYETLLKEIKKANLKRLPFDFTHYLLISKVLVGKNGTGGESFVNAEEEVFVPECDWVCELCDKEPVYRQDWSGQDQFLEKRKILVFRAENFEKIVKHIVDSFPIPQ